MSKGRFAIGAIIGAVAGVVAGVMTAPKSGKETRVDLKTKAEELKNEASRRVDDVQTKADELKTKGERIAKDKVDQVKHRFDK